MQSSHIERPIDPVVFEGWTPENTHLLIQRWNEGASLRQIARELNHSRNAALGKAKRLGLRRLGHVTRTTAGAGREGQAHFRKAVFEAYGSCCCVTGCSQLEILQAAHIVPFAMTRNHAVTNGICVRIDVHSLFDCGLITVGPDYRVKVSTCVTDPAYVVLDGKMMSLPLDKRDAPDYRGLEWHAERIFQVGDGD